MYNSIDKQWEIISTNERVVEDNITIYYLSKNKEMIEELVSNGYEIDRILSITSDLTVEDVYKVLCSLIEGIKIAKQ